MVKKETITVRQLMHMIFIATLAVAVRTVPGRVVEQSGKAGWLSPLLAAVPTIIVALMLCRLVRKPQAGFSRVIVENLGTVAGKAVCAVYALWLALLAALVARSYSERLLSTTYKGEPANLFVIILLCLVLFAASKKLVNLARAGQLIFWVIFAVLAAVSAVSLVNAEKENILPVSMDTLPQAVGGAVPVIGSLSGGLYMGFLADKVKKGKATTAVTKWIAFICLVLAALVAVCIAVFQENLLVRLQVPFFMLAKGVRVFDTFERIEAIVVALWMATDFVMVTLLVMCSGKAWGEVFGVKETEIFSVPVVIAVFAISVLIAPDGSTLERISRDVVQPLNIVLTFGMIPVIWTVEKVREKILKNSEKSVDK